VKNLDMSLDALQEEKVSAEAKRVGRTQFTPIHRAPRQQGSSMLDLGLGIAGGAVNAYSIYQRGGQKASEKS
jgi:hypothetical protein